MARSTLRLMTAEDVSHTSSHSCYRSWPPVCHVGVRTCSSSRISCGHLAVRDVTTPPKQRSLNTGAVAADERTNERTPKNLIKTSSWMTCVESLSDGAARWCRRRDGDATSRTPTTLHTCASGFFHYVLSNNAAPLSVMRLASCSGINDVRCYC